MIEDFKVKPSFEGSENNSHWHFTVTTHGLDYNGHYDGGEILWFLPVPEDDKIKKLEEVVHDVMARYEPLDSIMRQ